jgi:hypothetical protein
LSPPLEMPEPLEFRELIGGRFRRRDADAADPRGRAGLQRKAKADPAFQPEFDRC